MSNRIELETIVRRWISLWNVPVDWALFDQIHAPNFEDCASAGRPSTKAGFAQGLVDFTRAFPDVQTSIEGLVIDVRTSQIAVRWHARGTNKVRYLGIGPTNRLTDITGIEIIEVQKGAISRRWGEWDISDHHE